ncbi:MAG: PKD domain-containing protein, partial [Caldilineaceae bacterium]|nr:PKD domain-containing protein [Caldilineaceae bacterium]
MLDFDWGLETPSAEITSTAYSARWSVTRNFPAGIYRFSIWVDDGVRLWIDDVLIIDQWQSGPVRSYVRDVNLVRGDHTLRVEYFNAEEVGLIRLNVGYVLYFPDWKAEYFPNLDLEGSPVLIRNEQAINYNWGSASPAPGVPADAYSVRWSRRAPFDQGSYTFKAQVEGGMRLWVDNVLLIDSWGDQGPRTLEATTNPLTAGDHDLRVEYMRGALGGAISLTWQPVGPPAQPPSAVISAPNRAQVGQTVLFDGNGSLAAPGRQIVSYSWDFGDGSTAAGPAAEHGYVSVGIYNVTLTVVDDTGLTDSATLQIRVDVVEVTPEPATPPVAVITAPSQGTVGAEVTFDARSSQSTNPIVSFAWDFGDGTTANAVLVNKIYGLAGIYNVTLLLTDDQGLQGRTNHQVEILSAAPTPVPQPTATPTATPSTPTSPAPVAVINAPPNGTVGVAVPFDGSGSQSQQPITQFAWAFGDGSAADGIQMEKVYGAPGTYVVELRVTDQNGSVGANTVQIQIASTEAATPTPEQPTATPTVIAPPLTGKNWVLTSYWNSQSGSQASVLAGTQITALFDGATLSGFGGCNNYSTGYQTNGASLNIAPPAVNSQIC